MITILYHLKSKLSFHAKLLLSLTALFFCLFMILGLFYYKDINQQHYYGIKIRAQIQAKEIAIMPTLAKAIENNDLEYLNQIMQQIANRSDASYVVIGDNQGRHLFHSLYNYPEKIGEEMVGGDNAEVLNGNDSTSIRHGGIGISLRSKSPIFNDQHQVIGIVSVGYLTSYIDGITENRLMAIFMAALLLFASLFLFSLWFTHNIKKHMLFLEPKEIGLLVLRQKALLESLYEGVIAIDPQGRVQVVNQAAKQLLSLTIPSKVLRDQPIENIIGHIPLLTDPKTMNEDMHDQIFHFNGTTVIANRVRIMLEGELQGWVISFRDKNDIHELSIKLSQVQQYADNLRILRHEQLNWTAGLSGLLHMKRYDEAINYIEIQSEHAQELLDFVSSRFSCPRLCGLLIGKYAQAKEKGIRIHFDEGCYLDALPNLLPEIDLMSIIGNLIDNAIDATLKTCPPFGAIDLSIFNTAQDLIIEVADQGVGIDAEQQQNIFELGYSSKKTPDHGIGLHLVATYVSHAKGSIEVSNNLPQGTVFSLFIPMNLTTMDAVSSSSSKLTYE